MHFTLKTNPLKRSDLDEFVTLYKPEDPRAKRRTNWAEDKKPEGRWRSFTYDEIIKRDKANLGPFRFTTFCGQIDSGNAGVQALAAWVFTYERKKRLKPVLPRCPFGCSCFVFWQFRSWQIVFDLRPLLIVADVVAGQEVSGSRWSD